MGQGWRKFLRVRPEIADNFVRNFFAWGNLSLLSQHFLLFQRCLIASYNLIIWRPGCGPAGPPLIPALQTKQGLAQPRRLSCFHKCGMRNCFLVTLNIVILIFIMNRFVFSIFPKIPGVCRSWSFEENILLFSLALRDSCWDATSKTVCDHF